MTERQWKQLESAVSPGKIIRGEPLARYTTLKIGGAAEAFFDAKTTDELIRAIIEARACGIPLTILGGGSNVLISDRGIQGLVIKNSTHSLSLKGVKGKMKSRNAQGYGYIEVDSGVPMNQVVRFSVEEGLGGLEMHLGLPGTVGGAIYMNSKWTHPLGYVGDVVYQATILTGDNRVCVVPKSYFQFGYDFSSIQKTGDIVLDAIFQLKQENKALLWQRAGESMAYRRVSQPQGIFSAGCTFKNISASQAIQKSTPNGATSAGFLVDHAGMKGANVGAAEVSSFHANFIVNKGKATASDMVQLIEQIKDRVFRQFGISLEEEIVRLGEF